MSLRYAILVALTDGPKTGYDVAKQFDESTGLFWRAQHSQIYRELRKLKDKGYVQSEEIEQTGKPNRIVFQITALGRSGLFDWSQSPSEPQPMKDDFLVQLYGIESVDLKALRENLFLRLDRHKDRQKQYEAIHNKIGKACSLSDLGRKLALEVGMRNEREWASWCAHALEELSEQRVRELSSVLPIKQAES
ncbi:PadR family transcriptional regulator [Sphingorhabdus sp. EL138]|uniref:PadR family transcriptional regulator n=1 Tax=Sphingorhabdus sp. EL138 TaxID=2073156 RepID=UPI000D69AB89|nr:PadR family transcriptional regulator [Sphingorhabdus sp. EL138]